MKQGIIRLTFYDGVYECNALVHECGLAMHEHLACNGMYTITHIASGKLVCWDMVFSDKCFAWRWLLAISTVLPWHEQSFDQYDYSSIRVELIEACAEVLIP